MENHGGQEIKPETERRFLVTGIPDLQKRTRIDICQGYLKIGDDGSETRVRRRERIGKPLQFYYSEKTGTGLKRQEKEIEIKADEFSRKWSDTKGQRIFKTRFLIPHGDGEIELDIFEKKLLGLVIAEIEYKSEEASRQTVLPEWFGREITGDSRYRNHNLARYGIPEGYPRPDLSGIANILGLLFNPS